MRCGKMSPHDVCVHDDVYDDDVYDDDVCRQDMISPSARPA